MSYKNPFDNFAPKMKRMVRAQAKRALQAGAQVAESYGAKTELIGSKKLYVTMDSINTEGTLDLKPYFAKSSHIKYSKNGGWYLVVPIKRQARTMSSYTYRHAQQMDTNTTDYIKYLYGGEPIEDSTLVDMGVKSVPLGGNLTKQSQGATRSTYIAYRTVSAKSPASSWLVNKNNAQAKKERTQQLKDINSAIQDELKLLARL